MDSVKKLIALFFALLLAGCAQVGPLPAPDNYVAPGLTGLPPQSRVVILPIVGPEHEFAKGELMALGQLRTQLQAAGYRIAALDKANYELIWRQEVEAVGGIYDAATGAQRPGQHAQAMSSLARRVCQEANCALLLRYQLVVRRAELDGKTADWDGQRRPILISGAAGQEYRSSGTTDAVSLELLAMSADGSVAFKSYAGASLPYRNNAFKEKLELRDDLFQNDAEIADAVRLALAPVVRR